MPDILFLVRGTLVHVNIVHKDKVLEVHGHGKKYQRDVFATTNRTPKKEVADNLFSNAEFRIMFDHKCIEKSESKETPGPVTEPSFPETICRHIHSIIPDNVITVSCIKDYMRIAEVDFMILPSKTKRISHGGGVATVNGSSLFHKFYERAVVQATKNFVKYTQLTLERSDNAEETVEAIMEQSYGHVPVIGTVLAFLGGDTGILDIMRKVSIETFWVSLGIIVRCYEKDKSCLSDDLVNVLEKKYLLDLSEAIKVLEDPRVLPRFK